MDAVYQLPVEVVLTEKQQRQELTNYKVEQELHNKLINDPLLISMVGIKTITQEIEDNDDRERQKIEKLVAMLLSGKSSSHESVIVKRIG